MNTDNVWFNRGRWIVRCPVCGAKNRIRPKQGDTKIRFYCGACYPDKLKKKVQILPNGTPIIGYDGKAQRRAAQEAMNNNEIHTAILPEGWEEAERLLRQRKKVHQAWYPGDHMQPNNKSETLEDLKAEQESDPILHYLPERKNGKEAEAGISQDEQPEEIKEKKPKKNMTDREFRSLQ